MLLHANVHELATHSAVAFPTLVVHAVPHVPQLVTLVVVSTQVPLHMTSDPGHPETHVELAQTVPPLSAVHTFPQAEQLLLSVARFTHAPLQRVKPLLQVNVQLPPEHAGVALATPGQE